MYVLLLGIRWCLHQWDNRLPCRALRGMVLCRRPIFLHIGLMLLIGYISEAFCFQLPAKAVATRRAAPALLCRRTRALFSTTGDEGEAKSVEAKGPSDARPNRGFKSPQKGAQQSQKGGPPQQKGEAEAKKKPQPPPRGNNLLVVGLGNPGDQYKMTRHNAGFMVVDQLAKRLGADMKLRSAFQGEYGSANYRGKSVGLLRPITFMNNSGQSIRKVLDYFKLPYTSVLVVVDETALDLGQLRLRKTGTAGGHNGLKSIEAHLKTRDYARLRVGVGAAAPGRMVEHVLGEFSRSERSTLSEVIEDGCDAVEDWILDDDIDKVMSRINAPK